MRRGAGLALALLLAACGPQRSSAAPASIQVDAVAVPEWDPGATPGRPDHFAYAGGLHLTSKDTSRLHGLSDLEVLADGRMIAVSDEGDLVRGRIVLDAEGRLAGVADMTLGPLTGLDGKPLSGAKTDSDSEGLALWSNGDLMISFERHHRIWLYPAAGGPPHAVPFPDAPFPDNEGMEALAIDAKRGADAYIVGREDTRETWRCRLSAGCEPSFKVGGIGQGWLVSARPMPADDGWVFLLRDYNPLTKQDTIRILITDAAGKVRDTHVIARPATVDNFEGVAALPGKDGGVRLYIIADDNFSASERTLLLAFDWRPAPGGKP